MPSANSVVPMYFTFPILLPLTITRSSFLNGTLGGGWIEELFREIELLRMSWVGVEPGALNNFLPGAASARLTGELGATLGVEAPSVELDASFSTNGLMAVGLTKTPYPAGQSKYATPCTLPSFLPSGVDSSTPHHGPGANFVSPENLTVPIFAAWVVTLSPTSNVGIGPGTPVAAGIFELAEL